MCSRLTFQAACHVVASLNLGEKRRRRRTCRTETKDPPFARQHPRDHVYHTILPTTTPLRDQHLISCYTSTPRARLHGHRGRGTKGGFHIARRVIKSTW